MKTARIEFDELAVRSHTGRYYRYSMTLFEDGRVVGHRRFENQEDAEQSAKNWEAYDESPDSQSIFNAIYN